MSKLENIAKDAPNKPGVYKFLDIQNQVLYVGKAKNLHKRLLQYTSGQDKRLQLPFLLMEASTIEYTVVKTELESLMLENTLIKEFYPPYNIKLRDDKNYAFIKIDYSSQIPQLTYVRQIENDNGVYYGPFSSVKNIKTTLDYIRRVFKFCAHTEVGKRPCFYYYLHRCPGVCVGEITIEEYKQQLSIIKTFLSGQIGNTTKTLQKQMVLASKQKKYEVAAKLRDQINSLHSLTQKQLVILNKKVNWDIVSVFGNDLETCVTLFKVRDGKLKNPENFVYSNPGQINLQKTLQTFCAQYYFDTSDIPKEIFLQQDISDNNLIKQLIKNKHKKNVSISQPKLGQKIKLIKLAEENAKEYLYKWQTDKANNIDFINKTLEELQQILNLKTKPNRIECYDISNIQGTNPVGSMVVFENGIPAKSQYRKFKITSKQTPDDFAMMHETLTRRLTRIDPPNPKDAWPKPDLIIIDGGKGQLGVAVEIIEQKKLKIPVVGLAKRIEEIFLPHNSVPIILPHSHPVLQLMQRLRDEAHRFGITFHRSLRSKQAVKSALDSIPGIGPKTKKLLKQKIGTVDQIKKVPIDELENLVGKSKAKIIKSYLK